MLEILIISVTAFVASLLTLYSGFGLGTLLMPVVALFFPIEIAVAITAIVHLGNNLFKAYLLGRHAHWQTLLRFGLPALVFSIVGAALLARIDASAPLVFEFANRTWTTNSLNLVIGSLILFFVSLDLIKTPSIHPNNLFLAIGGALSGFFGGLSGHQGAFRSMFLIQLKLSKETFIGTGVLLAVIVDVSRLGVYANDFSANFSHIDWLLVGITCVAALLGAKLGAKLVKKVTIGFVQKLVAIMLAAIAVAMMLGVV